ncbi:hypothetical protein C8J56DRAFT_881323 [Mycena floridula]|nr:hypothetical protein C8J56DRAFT_881323 [Mycena floridula]
MSGSSKKRAFSQLFEPAANALHDAIKGSIFCQVHDLTGIEYPSSKPSESIHFVTNLTDEQKRLVFQYILANSVTDPQIFSARALAKLASEHSLKKKKRDLLIVDFETHLCTWSCLI